VSSCKQYSALALVLIVLCALPGCASYDAYIKCKSDGCPDDARITADVRALFKQHAALQPPNVISVQTLDQVVYLSGRVDTTLERSTAETVAIEVAGVKQVVNSIDLSYTGR
jgi:osmotically-inducible protein OsmY